MKGLPALLELTALKFVRLGRDDDGNEARAADPVKHEDVVLRGLVAGVEKEEDRLEGGAPVEVVLDHFAPLHLDVDAGRRIAVTGKVDEVELVVDVVVVDRLRLARLRAGPRIGLAVHETVDECRLADVALPRKRKFRHRRLGNSARHTADNIKIYRSYNHTTP